MKNNDIIKRILEKKKLLDSFRPLSKAILKNLQEYFTLEWTYNSNAIEGNSLTLRETQLVLREGITIKGKTFNEHLEAKNHEKAIEYLESLIRPSYKLKEKDILDIHSLVLKGIEEDFAGRYRTGRVRIVGANFVPPNHIKVSELMSDFVKFTNNNPEKLDIINLCAIMHHKFVWIHPFFDGNGRTGRLIMNLWLMKYGYPPAVILKNDRKKYYDALNLANNGNYEKLILIIAQTIERSLDMYLEACDSKSDEYVPLGKLSKKFPYSQEYLSLLARQGKIDAFKQSRNWVSTEAAIKKYIEDNSK